MSHSKIMRQDDIRKIIFHHLFLDLMFTETYGHCSIIVLRDPISMGQKLGILIVVMLQILTNLKMGIPVCGST